MGKGEGKGGCSREAGRIIIWMSWVTVWLITTIYVALAVVVFGKLLQSAYEKELDAHSLVVNKIWRAPLSSLSLSSLLVFGFNLMSCVTLIKKSINRSGPGFGYGFIMAFSFSLSFFLLLCALVLDGFRPQVQLLLECKDNCTDDTSNSTSIFDGVKSWSKYSSETFVAAEVFCFMSFIVYLLFAVLMVVLQAAVSEQLGIEPHERAAAAAAGVAGVAGAAATVATMPVEFESLKNGVSPPDYDQTEYFEQYGGYAEDEQYNQTGFQAPSGYVASDPDAGMGYYTEGVGADDHYSTPDYNSHDGGSGSAAPPMFTNTGFGAINQFVTAPGSDHSSRSMSNPPTGYTFAGNQQV